MECIVLQVQIFHASITIRVGTFAW